MTTITWKESVNGGSQIIKLDDRRGSWPGVDDEVELNGRKYKVVGVEEAVVLVEATEPPPADPVSPAQDSRIEGLQKAHLQEADSALAKRNARVEQRLEDEKLPVKAGPASKHPDFKPAPKHVAQHRTRDPLRSAKVVSHKKK